MESKLFNSMGLQNLDIAYLFIGLIVIAIGIIVWLSLLTKKQNRMIKNYEVFMQGKNARSLEDSIATLFRDTDRLKEKSEANRKEIQLLFRKNAYAFQKFGILKYDAFHELGGKLSFSLCLLNEKDDGFILNSIHSSDGTYSYTKAVHNGKPDVELTEEENQVLNDALNYNIRKEEG